MSMTKPSSLVALLPQSTMTVSPSYKGSASASVLSTLTLMSTRPFSPCPSRTQMAKTMTMAYDMTRACICADKVKVTNSTPTKILGGPRQTVEMKRIERDLKAAHNKWAGARRLALEREEATAAVAHFHTGGDDPDSANTSQTAFV